MNNLPIKNIALIIFSVISIFSSDLLGQVTLYQNYSYAGRSTTLKPGRYNMNVLAARIGNDQLSSVKIAGNYKITIYEHGDFQGRTKVLKRSVNLTDFNDKASSVVIEKLPEVIFYQDYNYGGKSMTLTPGRYDINTFYQGIGNDQLSSVKIPSNCRVYVYQHGGFQGAYKTLTGNVNLTDFNDQTSSVIIQRR